VILEALTRTGRLLESSAIEGSGRLGVLPWVFRLLEQRTWELVGVGSTTRRETELLVAVPREARLEGGTQQPVGDLLDRRLIRIGGEVAITTSAGLVRVRTGQIENSASAFELRGSLFRDLTVPNTEVWKGLPKVKARYGSVEVTAVLEVRATSGTWGAARGDEVGALDLRALRSNEIVFQDRIVVAPDDLVVRISEVGSSMRPGVIEVESSRLSDAGVRMDPAWQATRDIHLPLVRIEITPTDRPPARLPLRLAFRGAFLDGTVPFPFRAMRFEAADGGVIAPGTSVHARRLGGLRAVGLAPAGQGQFHITLRAELEDPGLVPPERTVALSMEPTGEHALELRDLQSAILAMLDATEDLDARIRVSLWQSGGDARPVALFVRRYDWRLVPDHETGDVALADFNAGDLDVESVSVEARPFTDIGAAVTLSRLRSLRFSEPRWVFDPAHRRAGPWLITAHQGGWYRCRPVAFQARGVCAASADGLRAILELGDEAERMRAMRDHLEAMSCDWAHSDWPLLESYARLLGNLPASTFDLFRVLATVPAACASLALRVAGWAPTELVAVIDGLDELIFSWTTLPLSAWGTSFEGLFHAVRVIAPELAISEVHARVTALGAWVHPAPFAFQVWVRRAHPQVLVDVSEDVRLCLMSGAVAPMLAIRADAVGELIRRHVVDDVWPDPAIRLPANPRQWSVVTRGEVEHRKAVLDAPVLAARSAAGLVQLARPTVMFIETARGFDETYFDQCFKLTYSAILASGQGVW
jgi:hypothetical protein